MPHTVRHRGGRKIREKKMRYLEKLQRGEIVNNNNCQTVKPQGTSIPTICNDNLKDNQHNKPEVESFKKELLVNIFNDPQSYNICLREEKDVKMERNSSEIDLTSNMSFGSQNILASFSRPINVQLLQETEIRNGNSIIHQTASPSCDNVFWASPVKQTETHTNMINLNANEQLAMNILNASSDSINMDINSILSPDYLKTNNTHRIEDPTGLNRRPPLLPLPLSSGHCSSSPMTQTTSSVLSASAPSSILTSPGNEKTNSSEKIKKETVPSGAFQRYLVKQLSKNINQNIPNSDCSLSDKIFGQLVGVELEKIPEPEKLKRKQAIMNILWKP
ncbi:PREDICTED: uncharacterized protein LOC106741115 [Dinoponera quadriceps]|uniref:Uncharacterized protein LOC106741115 n=1 Tax=Dinoponera quadriceps TaxID=609295 RepID=A0A6P3WQ76_DINQU|nr:PREDICTED: uncharacterized protein LOC106741115 [Dinoponera quadriceps]